MDSGALESPSLSGSSDAAFIRRFLTIVKTMQKEPETRRAIERLFFESLLDWTSVEGWGHYQLQDDRFLLYDNELYPVIMVIVAPSNVELTAEHEDVFRACLEAMDVPFGVSTNLRTFNLYRRDVRDGVRRIAGIDLRGISENSKLPPQEREAILKVKKLERARFMKIDDVTKYC